MTDTCTLAAPAVQLPPCAPFVQRILKHPRVMHYNRLVALVLAGNIAFAVLVAVVLAAGWLPLTQLGVAGTIAFTVVTLVFAYAQYLGVRRLA